MAKKVTKLQALKKSFDGKDLLEAVTEAMTAPTSRIMYLMTCEDEDNQEPIINMAIARAVYLAYSEGDIKRLDWLLSKMGITSMDTVMGDGPDLSKLNNESILKALKHK